MVIAIAVFFGVTNVSADSGEIRKIESLEYRGLGGVDLTLDSRILSNVISSTEGWKFSVFNLDVIGNWTESDDAIDLYSDMFNAGNSLAAIIAVNKRPTMNFGLRARVEPFRISWGTKKIGRLTVGAYNENDVVIHNAPLDTSPLPVVHDGINSYVDFSGTPDIAAIAIRSDIGGLIGYTRMFELPLGIELSAGVQGRVMHRWLSPKTAVRFNGHLGLATFENALQTPDFNCLSGIGFAVDLSSTVAFHDPILDARLAVTAENFGTVWYNGDSQSENPRFSVGTVVTPLHVLGKDSWKLGTDFENLQDGLTWQIGTLYTLGNDKFSISPQFGYIHGENDMFFRANDFITAGLSANLRGFHLRAVYEYNLTFDLHNVGFGLEMTF
ncbi:MAG: hypothetical protein COU29_00920 [Candidatus Magasanikbacteria bacterium CG10_big_fil_rev_8_21_14_0_10_36_32]|uniref:Uncharacterized protein n=1 Tax=Candidatus Magasanikbacteria bacterium CG10_big_fil_rev_8_21_14_0_10_36_32 TaxID=1974646 RepID=A0A2M6W6C5_9BACT|nr:MAG: hypothetical protein COU29_00920 [Candidatus Magasanikbacteria bacterium CG10_big_fil_rev_8_21_14_0_10_36_32]